MNTKAFRLRLLPQFTLLTMLCLAGIGGSGVGLWLHWSPWYFFETDNKTLHSDSLTVIREGGKSFHPGGEDTGETVRNYVIILDEEGNELFKIIPVADGLSTGADFAELRNLKLLAPDELLICGPIVKNSQKAIGGEIWKRRRPEPWWGVAWLPEFWISSVLLAGTCFSIWKDRQVVLRKNRV